MVMPYTSAMKRVAGGTTLRNINVQMQIRPMLVGPAANHLLASPATQYPRRGAMMISPCATAGNCGGGNATADVMTGFSLRSPAFRSWLAVSAS